MLRIFCKTTTWIAISVVVLSLPGLAAAQQEALEARAAIQAAPGGDQSTEEAVSVPPQELLWIDPPAPAGSRFPALAVEGPTTVIKGHQILMTWLEPNKPGWRLRFSRLSEEGWSQPVTIAESVAAPTTRDAPSVTVIDTQAVRRTLVARTGGLVARSGDGGRTWTRLAGPDLPYASFTDGDEGGYVFWLAPQGVESTRLLGTRILAGETLVDPRVAVESGTSAAMTWDGPVVVYRDQSDEGFQDIAIVRREDARWTEPDLVYKEGEQPIEEPTSGPRVAALRRDVAVAWYGVSEQGFRVLVAFSKDAGRSFGFPVEVNSGKMEARARDTVDVVLDNNGNALVLWMAGAEREKNAINLTRVSSDGRLGEKLTVDEGLINGMPQLVRAGKRVAVTWIDGSSDRVRCLVIPLEEIPAPEDALTDPRVDSGPDQEEASGKLAADVLNLKLTSLQGQTVSLAGLDDRVVLLNLWATWCAPCVKEMPELAALHERYGGDGLVVVGVSVDDPDAFERVRRFVSERAVPFEVWLDPKMRLFQALGGQSLPATLIFDHSRRILLRRDEVIAADDPQINKTIRGALEN